MKESTSEVVESQQTTEDTTEVPTDSGSTADGSNTEQPKEKEEVHKEKAKDAKKEKGKEKDSDRKVDHEKEKGKSLDVANFERLLQRLPGCVSRDLIDQLTVRVLEMVFILMLFQLNFFCLRCLLLCFIFRWTIVI